MEPTSWPWCLDVVFHLQGWKHRPLSAHFEYYYHPFMKPQQDPQHHSQSFFYQLWAPLETFQYLGEGWSFPQVTQGSAKLLDFSWLKLNPSDYKEIWTLRHIKSRRFSLNVMSTNSRGKKSLMFKQWQTDYTGVMQPHVKMLCSKHLQRNCNKLNTWA